MIGTRKGCIWEGVYRKRHMEVMILNYTLSLPLNAYPILKILKKNQDFKLQTSNM
jgi:hypothetical protein